MRHAATAANRVTLVRVRVLLLALVLSTGCDKLFRLAHIDDEPARDAPTADVTGDGVRIDAPVDAVTQTHSNCPSSFFAPFENSRYQYLAGSMSWSDAQLHCLSKKDPTSTKHIHLAVLSSDFERNHIYVNVVFSASAFWSGLSDTATEGTMKWVTNEAVAYPVANTWQSGEPDDEPADDCVRVEYSNTDFVALACATISPYVCECDDFAPAPANYVLQ